MIFWSWVFEFKMFFCYSEYNFCHFEQSKESGILPQILRLLRMTKKYYYLKFFALLRMTKKYFDTDILNLFCHSELAKNLTLLSQKPITSDSSQAHNDEFKMSVSNYISLTQVCVR